MNGREFWALQDVSNEALEASLSGLLGAGARVEARIVAHLAEAEERRLHLLAGCSSMYDYCHKRLGLSDYEAFIRIATARVARKYPVVFEMLERRELNLTAVCEVRKLLTVENHRELLAEISGKTKLKIREILAHRYPQADAPTSLTRLPSLEPLAPGRYRLTLTLSAAQKRKLELARGLLSHANPNGDLGVVLERALDELILRLEKRRLGRVSRAAAAAGSERVYGGREAEERLGTESGGGKRRRHIRHETRRELLARDGFRCGFVNEAGVRCDARAFLQFHHRHPWARGGSDSADNLELLCRSHNRLLAERDFERAHIEDIIAKRAEQRQKSAHVTPTALSSREVEPRARRRRQS